jgi:hypothetical protein
MYRELRKTLDFKEWRVFEVPYKKIAGGAGGLFANKRRIIPAAAAVRQAGS